MGLKVVTWVQGTLRMVEGDVKRSRVYSVSSPTHNLDDLKAHLPALLEQGSRGARDILLVTDSALLLPAVEEIPPAEIKLAARLLAKRVEKAKVIDEPFSTGVQPILAPGRSFEYQSACPLYTTFGCMEGEYEMVLLNEAGEWDGCVEVKIGRFALVKPEMA